MLRNYFKIALRNLLKTKGYSMINIGGLAVGMSIALLIGLWIYDELSFNKQHKNYEHIAQVMSSGTFNGKGYAEPWLARPLEGELRNKYGSGFKQIVMSRLSEEHILSVGEKKLSQTGRFMQPGAPEMLSLEMLKGTWSGLTDLSSIMLSASAAKALFGNADPLHQTVRIDNKTDVKVTGVYQDLPRNSDFSNVQFLSTWDLMLSQNQWMQDVADNWGNTSFFMYVQIHPNTSFEAESERIKNSMWDVADPEVKKFDPKIFLFPMRRWHLYSEWKDGVNIGGRIQYVWLFGIIGAFVLLLACINFMNLSTARSEKRAKEVGIRKAIGSLRKQLIFQFLSESFLVVFIAFLFALLLVSLTLPWFNQLADKQMQVLWLNPLFWSISLAFIVITSLIAGSYPAFYLSSFNPVKVLKGTFQAGHFASLPRKVLVVVQFTVSVVLMIGTIIVYRQIQHAKNRPVGYDRSGLVMVQVKSDDLSSKLEVLETELKREGIAAASARSSSPVTGVWSNDGSLEWRGKDPNKVESFGIVSVTYDFGKTVGWKFKEGRDFSRQMASDSLSSHSSKDAVYSIVVNEAAANYMGFKNPIGEIVKWSGYSYRIVGVIENMLMESPFDPVRHIVYRVNYEDAGSWVNIRISPQLSSAVALEKIEAVFRKLVPATPFDYAFADTEYGLKFAAEERIGKLSSVFATLAVLISCLGLLGLASFVAEQRTKEIGVRKVLGATVLNLWKLLSKDFLLLILVACVLAVPLAIYFLDRWLQNYEYRTELSWWIFAVAITGALLVTLLTVSFQAIKAALANPVRSLRSE
ncbi:MAG: Acidobacterial duplicated orphan permease (function unknown) [uncultured Segetibacter sp.]|uniref:ABC transporter, permease protein n=1 Tax=uncultured Segetibacter sp. TaxID=481133 RepID=A0A6J4S9E5_9BACT|nr:MAG: Acidobacterial duplicated orphan permease (function unknown) [uncultured Segetibacter sp.]